MSSYFISGDLNKYVPPQPEPEPEPKATLVHNADRITTSGEYTFLYWETSTFGHNSNLTVENKSINVDYLIVGGGGGGGGKTESFRSTGAGGGGGMITNNTTLTPATYPISIGSGGAGGSNRRGNSGQTSLFLGLGAIGGGGGAGKDSEFPPVSGGSGGGGNFEVDGASGITGQGYRGGLMNQYGSGGGGAGGVGGVGTSTAKASGGPGKVWLDGNEYSRGGSCDTSQYTNVFPNFGWGGDGVYKINTSRGGKNGYKGIVAIRVKTADVILEKV